MPQPITVHDCAIDQHDMATAATSPLAMIFVVFTIRNLGRSTFDLPYR
jgi:hypothetical protein